MRVVLLVAVAACAPLVSQPVSAPPPPPPPPLDIGFHLSGPITEIRVVELAAHDDGKVSQVFVAPGQHVRAGEVVVALELGDRASRVDAATAELADAERAVQKTGEDLQRTAAFLEYMKNPEYAKKLDEPNQDQLRFAEASLEVARVDRERTEKLFAAGAVTRDVLDKAIASEAGYEREVETLRQHRDTAKTVLEYSVARDRVLHTELELATRKRDDARGELSKAQLELAATRIVATASGVVEEVLVVPGGSVARDEPVVRMSSWQR